ncbi:MAG: carbohydrate kinase [Paludibacteraceae bacterium]|nr:carbohydrate kinase [Paludibacteraceae bacterium]
MRKVIGIGETILDIIFKNEQPTAAKPGGSTFNSMITLGRLGVNTEFISEVGRDRLGKQIKDFLAENNVKSENVYDYDGGKTALSLAFLDENMNADYLFYKNDAAQKLDYVMPKIEENDIIVIGSFFSINDALRENLTYLLDEAKRKKAIIYYDVNFRKNRKSQVRFLMPNILDNFDYATIVKGSDEDFDNIFSENDPDLTYKEHIEFYSKNFIYTQGSDGVTVYGKGFKKHYDAKKIEVVSTVGAGDNFNAGVVYGLLVAGVTFEDLKNGISEDKWDIVVKSAIDFSSTVCTTLDNYASKEYCEEYSRQYPIPIDEE